MLRTAIALALISSSVACFGSSPEPERKIITIRYSHFPLDSLSGEVFWLDENDVRRPVTDFYLSYAKPKNYDAPLRVEIAEDGSFTTSYRQSGCLKERLDEPYPNERIQWPSREFLIEAPGCAPAAISYGKDRTRHEVQLDCGARQRNGGAV